MLMFTLIAAAALVAGSWINVPGGTWNPNAETVAEAQAKLKSYVVAQAASNELTLRPWATYTFQYQGQEKAFKLRTRVLSKRRVIFINAFCSAVPSYAHTEFVSISDGGTCYFRAYYDTVQHKFIYVLFNGVA